VPPWNAVLRGHGHFTYFCEIRLNLPQRDLQHTTSFCPWTLTADKEKLPPKIMVIMVETSGRATEKGSDVQ